MVWGGFLLSKDRKCFSFAKLPVFPDSPFLSNTEDPLNGSTALWCVSLCSPFCIICEFAEGVHCAITQVISEKVTEYWQCWPLGYITCVWPPSGLCCWSQPFDPGNSVCSSTTSLVQLHTLCLISLPVRMLCETWKVWLMSIWTTSPALPSPAERVISSQVIRWIKQDSSS